MLTNKFSVDNIIEMIISFCKRIGLVNSYASFEFFTSYRKKSINEVIDYYRCLVERFGDREEELYFESVIVRMRDDKNV